MYKKRYSRKGFKPKENRDTQIYGGTREEPKNGPQEEETKIADGIQYIASRDLPKSTYAIPTSPYEELNQASEPYNYTARYNRKLEPKYKGERNLDSGYVSQYITATNSRIYKNFDSASLYVNINFRYLNISTAKKTDGSYETKEPDVVNNPTGLLRGQGILDKMYDAVSEAYSQLEATTFKDLHLTTKYSVISSVYLTEGAGIPMTYNDGANSYTVYCYTDPVAVILLASIHYQILLQQGVTVLKNTNKIKNYQRLMLKMQYEREIEGLNEYFGQINKQGFKNLLNTLVLSIQGEYLDVEWSKQNNVFSQIPARRSDSMIDPVLEILGEYNTEKCFVLVYGDTVKYAPTDTSGAALVDADELRNYKIIWNNITLTSSQGLTPVSSKESAIYVEWIYDQGTGQFTENPHAIDYAEVCHHMNALCSINDTLLWARRMPGDLSIIRPIMRYNNVVSLIRATSTIFGRIKKQFGDLRTIFDKLNPVGIINYKKAVTVDLTDKYNCTVEHYLLVDDIYRMYLSGADRVTFNKATARWTTYALWDKHYGIPLVDTINGGSFIGLCTKKFDCDGSYNSEVEYLPMMFSVNGETACRFINRDGDFSSVAPISYPSMTNNSFQRLAMLPDFDTRDIKVPTIRGIIGGYIPDRRTFEYLKNTVLNICGMCSNVPADDGTGSNNVEINPTILTIYPYEIVSTTKAMISYGKAYGPIKGALTEPASVGFADIAGLAKSE